MSLEETPGKHMPISEPRLFVLALGGPNGLLPLAHQNRAVTESFGKSKRVPAVFCSFLRKSAVFCENLRFPNPSFSRKRRESAKISENLRKSVFGLGLSP